MSIDFNNKFTICVYHLNTDCPFYNMPPILPIYIVLWYICSVYCLLAIHWYNVEGKVPFGRLFFLVFTCVVSEFFCFFPKNLCCFRVSSPPFFCYSEKTNQFSLCRDTCNSSGWILDSLLMFGTHLFFLMKNNNECTSGTPDFLVGSHQHCILQGALIQKSR